MYRVRVVQFEVDIFDDERPDFVAESICVKMALEKQEDEQAQQMDESICPKCTLKVNRALTLSAKTSATALSKFASIFMAS